MSHIVREAYETFIAATNLRRAPGGGGGIAVVTVVLLASLLTAAVEGQGSGLFAAGDSVGPGHGRRRALGATPHVGQRAVRIVSAPVLFILALLKEESS